MKKTRIVMLSIILVTAASGCSEKKKDVEPGIILSKWANATKELNYRNYEQCKAYAMPNLAFKKKFEDYYYSDIMVVHIEKPDKNDVKKDHQNAQYILKRVSFEAAQYKRNTHKGKLLVRGTVDLRNYSDGVNKDKGWLMSNMTIYQLK